MKVLKFGGTSVGSAEGLRQVKLVVESCREEVIVVVSAWEVLRISCCRLPEWRPRRYAVQKPTRTDRHASPPDGRRSGRSACRAEVLATVNTLLDELSNIFKGVYLIKDLSPKTSDAIVSYGERLSSVIVRGVLGCAELYDAVNLSRPGPISGNISSNSHRPKS